MAFFLVQVEAEEVDDVTEQYGVTTVPFFVFLQVSSSGVRLRPCSIEGLEVLCLQQLLENTRWLHTDLPDPTALSLSRLS